MLELILAEAEKNLPPCCNKRAIWVVHPTSDIRGPSSITSGRAIFKEQNSYLKRPFLPIFYGIFDLFIGKKCKQKFCLIHILKNHEINTLI